MQLSKYNKTKYLNLKHMFQSNMIGGVELTPESKTSNPSDLKTSNPSDLKTSNISDSKTCYGTYLASGYSDVECMRIIDFISDGNPSTLMRGLEILRNRGVWFVSQDEIKSIDPGMIRIILKKFGVSATRQTDATGIEFIVPKSYQDWLGTIVDGFANDIKSAINNNQNLKTYISNLILRCEVDRTILNPTLQNV